MIFQGDSTLKANIELPVNRDVTERLLKATLNPIFQVEICTMSQNLILHPRFNLVSITSENISNSRSLISFISKGIVVFFTFISVQLAVMTVWLL